MQTLDVSAIRAIRTKAEYEAALREAEQLVELDPSPRTDAGAQLEGLAILIQAYEAAHFPVDEDVSPQEIVEFVLDQRDMTRADLHELMGGKSRVSEFFSGKRPLSLEQIKTLWDELHIPPTLLLERSHNRSRGHGTPARRDRHASAR
jgi:HTH-type transcriptional regulator/antitoxin HigA